MVQNFLVILHDKCAIFVLGCCYFPKVLWEKETLILPQDLEGCIGSHLFEQLIHLDLFLSTFQQKIECI
jgi:hypothetical protein